MSKTRLSGLMGFPALAAIAALVAGCSALLAPTPGRPPLPAAKGWLRITAEAGGVAGAGRDTWIQVTDASGRTVHEGSLAAGTAELELSAGSYVVKAEYSGASVPYRASRTVRVEPGRVEEVAFLLAPALGTLRVRPVGPTPAVARKSTVRLVAPDGSELARATPGDEGAVTFVVAPGAYLVVATYTSSQTFQRSQAVRVEAGRVVEVVVPVVEELAWLRVYPWLDGEIPPQAMVELLDEWGQSISWSLAGPEGSVLFEVAPGTYLLRAQYVDTRDRTFTAMERVRVRASERLDVDLEMHPEEP